ncbi:MAG: hypothetical protein WCW52_08920 [Elusimicrobiales bacterium]|jgi:hypothetical protein
MGLKKILLFSLLLCACSCGGKYDYEEAVKLEQQGMPLKAADFYRLFAEKNPDDKRAPDSLFKAAGIYSRQFGLCSRSGPVYERLLKNYPSTPLRAAALKGLFICPDYFPVDLPLAWTYGDSQTGGANAMQSTRVADRGFDKVYTLTRIYAGRTLIARQKKFYRYSGSDLVAKQDGYDTIILKYPVVKGASWISRSGGRPARFTVVEAGLTVKVRAGVFSDCIKVKQQLEGLPSWIYEYYAPWTGKILTSVAGKGFENRVTELLKYEETQKK